MAAAVPTLFIAREDWAENAERWVRANMPGADFNTMPVHMGFATAPEEFNEAVARFVDAHS